MDKVIVDKLPLGKEIEGVKRWSEERGEFIQVAYGEVMRHLAIFELKKGFFRGGHYHIEKEEVFYVISGSIRAFFRDMDSFQTEEHLLVKGDRVRVHTRCGHVFHGLEDALVVEYSPQIYDKTDTYAVELESK
jgi:dTDP-4-dehydrorhamnose 3,5-epimerase-like enzyme